MKLAWMLLLFAVVGCRTQPAKIFQNTVSGRTYYHVVFVLTSANSSLTVPAGYQDALARPENVSAPSDEGSFEVFIRASEFPVTAPGCNGRWIILRMPATNDAKGTDKRIEAKKAVWERLRRMYSSKSGSEEVVVELNPYIRVIDASIPKVQLEYCNVFFRCAYGAYVPYIGPLREAKEPPAKPAPSTD